MRAHRLVLAVLSALCLAAFAGTAAAGAAQVAYIDGGQVWISTLDGAQKRSLSGPSPDRYVWSETAQAEDGTVIGVRGDHGSVRYPNATQLWGPDGAPIGNGTLTTPNGRTVYTYPVTLSLSPDGKIVTYGYSNSTGFGMETTFETGTYAEGSSGWYIQPFDVGSIRAGTLVGSRLVGISNKETVVVQNPTGQPPYSQEFTPWFNAEGVQRVEVSPSGTIAAVEQSAEPLHRIAMIPFPALGGPLPTDGSDCYLPAQGSATELSFSPDSTRMAWHDDRGVVVAGAPVWFASAAESTCNLSSPPVVISAAGTMPSLGNSTAATPSPGGGGGGAAPGGAPSSPPSEKKSGGKGSGGGAGDDGAPTLGSVPKTVKAASLAKGLPLAVTVKAAGKVTATGKVGGATVARAEARAKRAGKVTLRLKATRAWAKRLAQLSGKTLKITVKGPGGSTNLTRKLG
jgi:hypothetical protein